MLPLQQEHSYQAVATGSTINAIAKGRIVDAIDSINEIDAVNAVATGSKCHRLHGK